jgi:hypothetical protein
MYSDKQNLNYDKMIRISEDCFFYTNIKETRFGLIDEDFLDFKKYCEYKKINCYASGLLIYNMFRFSTQVPARNSYVTSEHIPRSVIEKFKLVHSVGSIPNPDLSEFEYFLYYLFSEEGSTENHPYSLYIPISLIKMYKEEKWNGFCENYKPDVNIKKIFSLLPNGEILLKLLSKEIDMKYFDSLSQYNKVAYYIYLSNNINENIINKFNDRDYGSFCKYYTEKELKQLRK